MGEPGASAGALPDPGARRRPWPAFRPIHQLDALLVGILLGAIGSLSLGGKTPNVFWADLFLMVLAAVWVGRGRRIRPSGLEKLLCLHFALICLTLPRAVDLPRSVSILKLHVMPLLVFIILGDAVRSRRDLDHACRALARFGAAVSLLILVYWNQYSAGLRQAEAEGVKEWAQVPWGRSNMLAGLLIMALPMAFPDIARGGARIRAAGLAMACLMAVALALTLSRGAMISLACGILAWAALTLCAGRGGWPRLRRVLAILLGCGLLAWIGWASLPADIRNQLLNVFQFLGPAGDSALLENDRTGKLMDAWPHILAHPLSGIGLGNQDRLVYAGGSAHNLVVETLLETGIFGALPLFAGLAMGGREILRQFRRSRPEGATLTTAFLVFYAAAGVDNMVEPHFWAVQYAYVFWAILALVYARRRLEREAAAGEC